MPGGGDWSGAPGGVCSLCGRRSENVGPRRGYDYVNDYCGGCCDLSSDDDGHCEEGYCRQCGKNLCKIESSIDHYCMNCVKVCRNCSTQMSPEKVEVTPLDNIIKDMIDETDVWEDILGDDAKDGDPVDLCKSCHKKWRRRKEKESQDQPKQKKQKKESTKRAAKAD